MDQSSVAAPPMPTPTTEKTTTAETTATTLPILQEQDQTHLKNHPASSPREQAYSRPNASDQWSLKSVLSTVGIIFLCLSLLLIPAFLVTRSKDEGHDHASSTRRPDTSNVVPARSAWFIPIFVLAWVASQFGVARLLGQGMQAMQGLGVQLRSPLLLAVGKALHVKELSLISNCTALSLLIIALSAFSRSYGWQAAGHDMCNRTGLDQMVYKPIVERRSMWSVFFACLHAVGQHVQISALLFKYGGGWITMRGFVVMVVSAHAILGLMVLLGLCRFAVVMQNASLLILGVHLVSWLVARADIFSGFLGSRFDLEFRLFRTLGELVLYTLILWLVKSAPVGLLCEPDSCGS